MDKDYLTELIGGIFSVFSSGSENVMFLKFEMTCSSHLRETLKWEIVSMMMFLCKLLFCSVELID